MLTDEPAIRRVRRNHALRLLVFAIVLGTMCAHNAYSQTAGEYQVKAAYLYNFAKLAEWPPAVLPSATSPLSFCIFGPDDDLANVFRTTLAGKAVGEHSISVKSTATPKDLGTCNLVFFRSSEKGSTAAAIASLNAPGVLLIGEQEDFLSSGGMLNLVLRDGKVRFQVNSSALEQGDIRYDASFLSMAVADAGRAAVQSGSGRSLLSSASPPYPDLAHRLHISGTVQLQAVVRADGSVKDVHVLGGHPVLAEAATQAVRLWRYRSGPGETVELVKITFGQ